MNIFGNSWDRSAIALIVATLTAFGISGSPELVNWASAVALAIGYMKGRLVVLDFMELRNAPLVWRGLLEVWLLVITLTLLAVYFFGNGMPFS